MAVSQTYCIRLDDSSGNNILTFRVVGETDHIQGIIIVDDDGDPSGVLTNPLHIQSATLLAALAALLTELQLKADLTETQPVSAATLPVLGGTQPVEEQEVPPTDAAKNNPSFVLTYVAGNMTNIAMTIGITTYNKPLTYDGDGNCITIGAWA